jgi:hypothetical protein
MSDKGQAEAVLAALEQIRSRYCSAWFDALQYLAGLDDETTPGPWRIFGGSEILPPEGDQQAGYSNPTICEVTGPRHRPDYTEHGSANAALIQHAPTLPYLARWAMDAGSFLEGLRDGILSVPGGRERAAAELVQLDRLIDALGDEVPV